MKIRMVEIPSVEYQAFWKAYITRFGRSKLCLEILWCYRYNSEIYRELLIPQQADQISDSEHTSLTAWYVKGKAIMRNDKSSS